MGTDYSFELISIETYAPQFIGHNRLFLGSVMGIKAFSSYLSIVRQLADIAMTEAANYKSEYGSPIPVKYLTDRVSNYVHAYTLYSALRPFGTTIMMGSYTDIEGPELYCIENSGLHYRYWGCAVSKF